MAYGDYDGEDKPDKGLANGSCNRGRCQTSPAIWYNNSTRKWYCTSCKDQIYDHIGQRYWEQNMKVDYPMFESRNMIDKRLAAKT